MYNNLYPGFPIVTDMGATAPSYDFLDPLPLPHQNRFTPIKLSPLKNEAPPPLSDRLKTLKNRKVALILVFNRKATLEKDGRNSTGTWFSHLGHSKFCVRKVKQFVRKYYITWLITQFVVIDIAPLTVLFCNHQLFSNWPLADL